MRRRTRNSVQQFQESNGDGKALPKLSEVTEVPSLFSDTNLPPPQPPYWLGPGDQLQRVCSDDLQEAALRGDIGLVRRLVQAGASVNAPLRADGDDEFLSLAHLLAAKPEVPNCTRILAQLMESSVSPNVRSSLGSTPLMFACLHKNAGAVEALLACGAHVSPVNDSGYTAMRCTVIPEPHVRSWEELSVEIVQLLLRSGADLNDGGTLPPMTEAVVQGNGASVKALLELRAAPDGLHEAVSQAPISIIKWLIDAEANPFYRDANGKTVMEAALARNDESVTTLLRDYVGNLERSQHPHLSTRRISAEYVRRSARAGSRIAGKSSSSTAGPPASTTDQARVQWQQFCRRTVQSVAFQVFMLAMLFNALFLPDLWIISNTTSTGALDVILLVICAAFLVEFLMHLIGHWSDYFLGFAFWMDLLGVASVPLDHSTVTNLLINTVNVEGATLSRVTKLVKHGVRSVRFSRLVKLIRFLPDGGHKGNSSTAKKMSNVLGKKVSIQVSCLIIMMVVLFPTLEFFMYPQDDYSMAAWAALIDRAVGNNTGDMWNVLADFEQFYSPLPYFPYEVSYAFANGTKVVVKMSGRVPERTQDRLLVEVRREGRARSFALFNFRDPNRTESICNCLLITTVILIMFTSSSLVMLSVSRVVLVPLERLLKSVQTVAGRIFHSVQRVATRQSGETADDGGSHVSGEELGFAYQFRLIAKVLQKLAALSEITARKLPIDNLEELDEDRRALLHDFQTGATLFQHVSGLVPLDRASEVPGEEAAWRCLEEAGLPIQATSGWDFYMSDLSEQARNLLCTSLLSCSTGADARCRAFVDVLCRAYGDPMTVPYHNWGHATDIAVTMFRCLGALRAEHFVGAHERLALIVSAMGHDVGHPGYNNAFLIETEHELTMQYNDCSPLEHMHCSRLLQITRSPTTNVFVGLSGPQCREIRQVCIESILHTDNHCHSVLVAELGMTVETNGDLINGMLDAQNCGGDCLSEEVIEFYCSPEVRKLIRAFLLHYVDISNSMKPWKLCKYWAELVFEEFFRQGDSEKALGVPVQALNDRENVNQPQVQVGYIEFFVAPLAVIVSKLMPPLRPFEETVHRNLEKWHQRWLNTQPEEDHQSELAARMARLQMMGKSQVGSHIMPSKLSG